MSQVDIQIDKETDRLWLVRKSAEDNNNDRESQSSAYAVDTQIARLLEVEFTCYEVRAVTGSKKYEIRKIKEELMQPRKPYGLFSYKELIYFAMISETKNLKFANKKDRFIAIPNLHELPEDFLQSNFIIGSDKEIKEVEDYIKIWVKSTQEGNKTCYLKKIEKQEKEEGEENINIESYQFIIFNLKEIIQSTNEKIERTRAE